ncbi:MAG: hypothetical protein Q8P75_00515 [bacterium]|nr:hypothetical protein [bacterium]
MESNIHKVEIVKAPLPKNWPSIIALVISIISLGFVGYNYFILERALIGISDFKIERALIKDEALLVLFYNITNYGNVPARDVKLKIYTIPVDDDNNKGELAWNDSVPGMVFPNTSLPYGGIHFFKIGDGESLGKTVALVFDIEYKDSLVGSRTTQLWFKYTIGDEGKDVVQYLLGSEKRKIDNKYLELKTNP